MTTTASTTVLEVVEVRKTYLTTPPVHALRGVSFAVQQGELVSVVGPSGSGKSTLLHLMGTLDRPTSGEITVAGHRVSLRQVGMGHRLDQITAKLSGGEMQRVATARAFAGNPAIVLADEPTGNLDTKNSEAIVAMIEELNASGVTMVVITHNPEIAERFPRVVALRDGQVEYDKGAQEVA